MKKIICIFGTRPEAIKMAPVIKELQRFPAEFHVVVCVTAQHRELLDQVLELFQIKCDYDLNIMKANQDLFDITSNVLIGLKEVLKVEKPDFVLVHGDTTTSMVASLAAYYMQIPVGHVEAGLRTGNKYAPFPEEINRKITGSLSTLHFAPTIQAKENLVYEGVKSELIEVTGNTVVDSLFYSMGKLGLNKQAYEEGDKKILLTAHRRENFGAGIVQISKAIKTLASSFPEVTFIYPVHPNPNITIPVFETLSDIQNVTLVAPVGYEDFIRLMNDAYIIITDSGGIQEEASALQKPVVLLRESTERPEGIIAGIAKEVGTNSDAIISLVSLLLKNESEYNKMTTAPNLYGDGRASERIVRKLSTWEVAEEA